MQQIINFIIRNKNFLLFLLLFIISFILTVQSHSFHRSKFISSANFLSGGIYNSVHNISQYLDLKTENKILIEENYKLRNLLFNQTENNLDSVIVDSSFYSKEFKFTPASLIKNSFSSTNNSLLVDKGEKDGVKEDFGVITSKGLIGIIDNTSNSYSRVVSILSTKSKINAQLKKTNHFGTLLWNGDSHEIVQLMDVPKIAPVQIGDTVITGGRSTIFPKGIYIGTITSFQVDNAEDFYEINIKLFNDMTNIGHVYIVENLKIKELINLEK
ncbi:MAG: rod shape-determining protein MreC [Flavobacteriaceae bacterium]|nr:rod shape-determining protein MreC [Flavobacteriaceae bacterium]